MKMKVDNFLDNRVPKLLIGRLTERFGGTFTLEPSGEDTFDLMWEFYYIPVCPNLALVQTYTEGYCQGKSD